MMKKRLLIVFLIVITGMCCTRRLSPEKYAVYIAENREKFCEVINRNGVRATVCYMPAEMYGAQRMIAYDIPPDSAMKDFINSLFLVCTVNADSMGNKSLLLERDGILGFPGNVYKHTFGHGEDIFLLNGPDTVKCAGYHFERNWGMTGEDSFIVTFDRRKLKEKMSGYHLIIREIAPELGTLDIQLSKLVKKAPQLKG